MKDRDLGKLIVRLRSTVKEALRQLDKGAEKILFVTDEEGHLIGTLTDGDIRRYILGEGRLTDSIEVCFNRSPVCLEEDYQKSLAKKIMLERRIEVLPVVDDSRRLVDYLTWERLFGEEVAREKIDTPVVVMAGGKGTRLDPFTKILPKPLIPVGEKPVVEVIMDKFHEYGVSDFYLTVNYKAEMIKSYFDNVDTVYNIHYLHEDSFLGTAGSLKLLPADFDKTFILTNCDVIIEADYADLVKFHKDNGHCLTVVGSIQHYRIPYGILEIERGGALKGITEKPEYDLVANTGLYVFDRRALRHVPYEGAFHMTELIQVLLKEGEKVGAYPVSEKSYVDIGQWAEYRKSLERFLSD